MRKNLRTNSMSLLFMAYTVLVGTSISWTMVPAMWWPSMYWWISSLFVFIACCNHLRDPSHFRLVCYAAVAGVVFAGLNLKLGYNEFGYEETRYTAFGVNSNFTSYIASGSVFILLITASIVRFPYIIQALIPAAVAVVFYYQIVLDTRGSLISTASIILVFLTRRFFPPAAHGILAVSIVLLAVLSSTGALNGFLGLLDSQSSRATGDLSGRTAIWADAIGWIMQSPLLGIGPASFAEVSAIKVGAHNFFLVILLETGILGLLVMMLFFFSLYRHINRVANRSTAAFLMAMFCAYWFPIATSGHWETAPFSWLVIGFMARIASVRESSPRRAGVQKSPHPEPLRPCLPPV